MYLGYGWCVSPSKSDHLVNVHLIILMLALNYSIHIIIRVPSSESHKSSIDPKYKELPCTIYGVKTQKDLIDESVLFKYT